MASMVSIGFWELLLVFWIGTVTLDLATEARVCLIIVEDPTLIMLPVWYATRDFYYRILFTEALLFFLWSKC